MRNSRSAGGRLPSGASARRGGQPDAEHRSHVQVRGQPDAEHRSHVQALRFRLARHHLAERTGDAAAAAVVGLQDTPPGTAAIALAARADVGPEALGELVLVPSVRGAPLAVAPRDLPVFTAGLAPPDEAAARTVDRQRVEGARRDRGDGGARPRQRRGARQPRRRAARARRLPPGAARAPARRAALVVQGVRQPPRASVAVARHRDPRGARDRGPGGPHRGVRRPAGRRARRRPRRPARAALPPGLRPARPRLLAAVGRDRAVARRRAVGAGRRPRRGRPRRDRRVGARRGRAGARRPAGRAGRCGSCRTSIRSARAATASSWCRTRRSASGSGGSWAGPGCSSPTAGRRPVARGEAGPPARRDGRAARAAQQGGEGRGRGGGGAPRARSATPPPRR